MGSQMAWRQMTKKKFVLFRNRPVWMDPKEVRLVSTSVIKSLLVNFINVHSTVWSVGLPYPK